MRGVSFRGGAQRRRGKRRRTRRATASRIDDRVDGRGDRTRHRTGGAHTAMTRRRTRARLKSVRTKGLRPQTANRSDRSDGRSGDRRARTPSRHGRDRGQSNTGDSTGNAGMVLMSTFLLPGSQGPWPGPIRKSEPSSSFGPNDPRVTDNLAEVASGFWALASPKRMAVKPSVFPKHDHKVFNSSRTSGLHISTTFPSIFCPSFRESRILGKEMSLGTGWVAQSVDLTPEIQVPSLPWFGSPLWPAALLAGWWWLAEVGTSGTQVHHPLWLMVYALLWPVSIVEQIGHTSVHKKCSWNASMHMIPCRGNKSSCLEIIHSSCGALSESPIMLILERVLRHWLPFFDKIWQDVQNNRNQWKS